MEGKKCETHDIALNEVGACPECLSNEGLAENQLSDPGGTQSSCSESIEHEPQIPEEVKFGTEPRSSQPSRDSDIKNKNADTGNESGFYKKKLEDVIKENVLNKNSLNIGKSSFGQNSSILQGNEIFYEERTKNKLTVEDGGSITTAAVGNEIEQLNILNFLSKQEEQAIPLFEKSTPISYAKYDVMTDRPDLVSALKNERILLLEDTIEERAFDLSCQIAKSLKIENTKRILWLLSLNNYPPKKEGDTPLNIHSFSFNRKETVEKESVVVIDANKNGSPFADSLLTHNVSFIRELTSILEQNSIFLICLLETGAISNRERNGNKPTFPCHVLSANKDKKKEIENELGIDHKAKKLLNDEDEISGPIIKIVLFVVSFFPNLTVADFNNLVRKWLKAEPDVTKSKIVGVDSETIFEKISLERMWNLKAHTFTDQCYLTQTRSEHGKKTINFENQSFSNYFKNQFESRFFVFIDKRLSEILDFALVFHHSDTISFHSINILSEYISEIEEKYTEWLLEIFDFLEDVQNLEELKLFFKTEENSTKQFYYGRLARLFRAMFRDSLKPMLSGVLEKLVQKKCHRSLLILIKNLQSAPNFDASHWLKQLLERGSPQIQEDTIAYLFSNLANQNIGEVMQRFKAWLPDDSTPIENYSRSNKATLILLIVHCFYQTFMFDEELYGKEPSQFPLFDFDDRQSAEIFTDLLIKYLMHPAYFILFSDKASPDPIIKQLLLSADMLLSIELPYIFNAAILLENWAEILCYSPPGSPGSFSPAQAGENRESQSKNSFLSNEEILDHLLKQTCLKSDKKQQDRILFVWEKYMEELTDVINDSSTDRKLRESAVGKRKMVRNLIERFKKCQRALR